ASYWIKQSIKRAVINTGKTIRLPAYMEELLRKWRRASASLQDELGRAPTEEEIAASLNLSRKKIAIIKKAIRIWNATPAADQARGTPDDEGDGRAPARDTGAGRTNRPPAPGEAGWGAGGEGSTPSPPSPLPQGERGAMHALTRFPCLDFLPDPPPIASTRP